MLTYVDKMPDNSAAKRKSTAKGSRRMNADEEKAVAKAYREIKEGKVRTFKNADEYLKYLDAV